MYEGRRGRKDVEQDATKSNSRALSKSPTFWQHVTTFSAELELSSLLQDIICEGKPYIPSFHLFPPLNTVM